MSQRKKSIREEFAARCAKRDHYRCAMCRTQIGRTVAHHITDRHEFNNGGYVPENGITVCDCCHEKAEKFHRTKGQEWVEGYHPNDLYAKIGSNYMLAVKADHKYD